MNVLLHACCGPCSLEPCRILLEQGHRITIYYANSNIAPENEYALRLDTLKAWAENEGVTVVEAPYVPEAWKSAVAPFAKAASDDPDKRCQRCRACYAFRFEESARFAYENGYEAFGTTLSVSPYQFTDIIEEELRAAAKRYGLKCLFQDYRPFYDAATTRSRNLEMYRQNYCGCVFSAAEAQAQRQERKAARKARKEAWLADHAEELARAEEERLKNRSEKQAYAAKQARKRAVLRELRQKG